MGIWAATLMCSLLIVGAASATETETETLDQAMAAAMSSNPALASARERARAEGEAVPLALAEWLPQINVNASANQTRRSERTFALTVREKPEYWIASLNTSWLLFASGRRTAAMHQARARVAAAAADYQQRTQTLLLDVARAYSGVLLARSVRDAQDRNFANLQEQYRYVDSNVRHGFLTQTDLAQARARVEQARASLSLADAQLISASETYERLVGHPPPSLETPHSLTGLPTDGASARAQAIARNPSVLSAAAEVEVAQGNADIAAAEGRLRVSVDITNSYFEPIDTPTHRRQSEDTAALRFSLPLFNGGQVAARTREENHLRRSARFSLAEAQNEINEQTGAAWANVIASRAAVEAGRARLAAAELAQHGMRLEQRAGQRSTIDVLNQEQELLSARVDLARAVRDETVSEFELASALGMLTHPPADAN